MVAIEVTKSKKKKKKQNLDVAVEYAVAGCFLKPSKVSVVESFLLWLFCWFQLISPLVSGGLVLVMNPVFWLLGLVSHFPFVLRSTINSFKLL